jgi:hypothetical protein
MPSKSYWQSAYIGDDRAKDAVKSWFAPMCDGMTPYKAEILCDIETDREKKARAFMTDANGKSYQFERTLGGKTFSISRRRTSQLTQAQSRGEA